MTTRDWADERASSLLLDLHPRSYGIGEYQRDLDTLAAALREAERRGLEKVVEICEARRAQHDQSCALQRMAEAHDILMNIHALMADSSEKT